MKTMKRSAALLLLVFLAVNPAYAGLESCRDPTPDERIQLDLCSAHMGCRLVVALMDGCASVTNSIRRFFLSQRPELDPGEYQSDRNAPLGPSEIEQARKDNELYQRNQRLRESAASDAYNGLVVLDRSIKARLERYCGNPLDQGCKDAVQDAESLANKFNAYNNNPDHVALRGRLTAESPGIAAPYGKLQTAAWEETNRKSEELNKSIRERQAAEQKLLEAEKKKKEGDPADSPVDGTAAKSPSGVDAVADLVQKGVSKVSDWFNKAFSSEQKPTSKEEESKREAGAWVDKNLADTQARADREQEDRNRKAQEASARLERAREAERIAKQTPAERISNSFDQRIAAARQQCAANDSSCNTGCMAVAAVGVLSIFMARGSASNAASEQVQQCSNRCDQAKSSCEQEVSALEQEKAQAIADSRAPRERTVGAPVASGGVNACAPDPGLFQTYVETMKEWARVIGRPEASVSVHRETFRQIRAQHIGWSDEMIRNQLEVQSRPYQPTGPQGPHIAAQSKIFVQMLKCETGQRQAAAASTNRNAGSAQVSVGGGQGSGGASDCKTRYDGDEAKNGPIVQRIQNTSSAVGQMQLLLGMLDRRISLLEQYCRGQPQYAEYAGARQQRAATMNNCRGIASNPGDCVPK